MKIAVLSDIHSNYEALSEVIKDSYDICDYYVNLGDIVGYNNDPVSCVKKLMQLKENGKLILSLSGNHDFAVLTGNYDGFNTDHGKRALDITRKLLGKSYLKYLENLIFVNDKGIELSDAGYKFNHCLVKYVNGKRKYINIYPSTLDTMITNNCKAIITGHSHLQFNEIVKGVNIINPGSIGQPRNCNNKAQYAIITIDDNYNLNSVELRQISYNYEKVAISNYKLGMDIFLSQRLYLGI